MKKIILIITLFLLSFSYSFSKPVYYTGQLYINSKIIDGVTPSVNFTIEDMEIGFPGGGNDLSNDYFVLDDKLSNGFITLQDVKIYSGTHLVQGNRVYFKRLDGKPMYNKDRIKISITGKIIFNWKSSKNGNLTLGKVVIDDKHSTNEVEIDFGKYLVGAIESRIQLQVVRDLHLGFGVAGEVFDSEVGKGQSVGGYPAEISITCEATKDRIELSIPTGKVTIRNENGVSKEVTLRFNNILSGAENVEIENDDESEIEFTPTGEKITIFINGNMLTSVNDPEGVYTGTFILRAEYDKN